MVAYSFRARFVGRVQAGLEPGPWLPGMKRHTLRLPRLGRAGHARPEQRVQLYTGMRTRQCRLIGEGVARVLMPVRLLIGGAIGFTLMRTEGPAPRSRVAGLAPIVASLLDRPCGVSLAPAEMDEFARTDGFADAAEMRGFFDPPDVDAGRYAHLDLVLVGWTPADPR